MITKAFMVSALVIIVIAMSIDASDGGEKIIVVFCSTAIVMALLAIAYAIEEKK